VHESWPVRWLHAQPSILASALRVRPDIVHAPGGDPVAGWPAARQVVTLHDVVPWTAPEYSGRRLLGAWLSLEALRLRRCGAIIADSSTVAEEAVGILGIERSRVHVVPLGVDPVFDASTRTGDPADRAGAGVAEAGRYVLWAGSLVSHDPRKALDVLVEAIAALTRRRPELTLVLAGAGGPEGERVAALSDGLGVRTVRTGFVADATLAALYRGAAAVAIPSRHEGFGLPALEAMACGAPVIASRAGNLEALVEGAGVLVPAGDAGALARALEAVLSDPALAARLAAQGPEHAAGFTWAHAAERTLEVYCTVRTARD
jgi:glycosyltransferase involved in cell wall biosynthesis